MADQATNIITTPAEQARLNLVNAMQVYYDKFSPSNVPDVSQLDTAYPQFIKDIKEHINRFNRDEDGVDNKDESSTFRTSWNNAAPNAPLKAAGDIILEETDSLDQNALQILQNFLNVTQKDGQSYKSLFNSESKARLPEMEIVHNSVRALLDDYAIQESQKHYLEIIDPQIISAEMGPYIKSVQAYFNIEQSGKLTAQTQMLINQTLASNGIPMRGSIANDTNAVKIFQDMLQERVKELRDEYLEEIEHSKAPQQTKILKDNSYSDHDIETILDTLDKSTSLAEAKTNLKDIITPPADGKKAADQNNIIDLLWAVEVQETLDMQNWSQSVLPQLNKDERALFNINTVLQNIHTGTTSNTLESIAGAQNTDVKLADDRLFRKEVYDALRADKSIDGTFMPDGYKRPGYMYSPQDVKDIAKDLLYKELADNGLEPKDLTQAILEGKFVPNFEDLKLIQDGLARPTLDYVINDEYSKGRLAMALETGLIEIPESSAAKYGISNETSSYTDYKNLLSNLDKNDDLSRHLSRVLASAPEHMISDIIDPYKSKIFSQEFGEFANIGSVSTTRHVKNSNGQYETQQIDIKAQDIAINILARFGNADFKSTYDINIEDARELIDNNQALPDKLNTGLNELLDNSSIVSYFSRSEKDTVIHGANYMADYKAMRDSYVQQTIDEQHQPTVTNNPTL